MTTSRSLWFTTIQNTNYRKVQPASALKAVNITLLRNVKIIVRISRIRISIIYFVNKKCALLVFLPKFFEVVI